MQLHFEEHRRVMNLEQNALETKTKKKGDHQESSEKTNYKDSKKMYKNNLLTTKDMYNKIDQDLNKFLNGAGSLYDVSSEEEISKKRSKKISKKHSKDVNSSKPTNLSPKRDTNNSYINLMKIKELFNSDTITKYKKFKAHKEQRSESLKDNSDSETSTSVKKVKRKKFHNHESSRAIMQSDSDSFLSQDTYYTPSPKQNKSHPNFYHKSHKDTSNLKPNDEYYSESSTPFKKNKKSRKHRTNAESDIELFSDLSESYKRSKQSLNGYGPIKNKKSHRNYEAKSEELHINGESIKDRGKAKLDNRSMVKIHFHNSDKQNNDKQSTLKSLLIINEKEDIKGSDKKSYDDAVETFSGSSQINKSLKNKKQNNNIQDSAFQFLKRKKKKCSQSNSESSTKTENDESNLERKKKDPESDRNDIEKNKCIRNSPKKCDSSLRTSKEKKRSYEWLSTLENESNRKTVQSENDSFKLIDLCHTPPKRSRLHSNVSLIDQPKETSNLRLHDEISSHSTAPIKKNDKIHKHSKTKAESDLDLFSDLSESSKQSFNGKGSIKKKKSHRDYEKLHINGKHIKDRGKVRLENTLMIKKHSHNSDKLNNDLKSTLGSFLIINEKDDIKASDKESYDHNAVEKSSGCPQISESQKNKKENNNIQDSTVQFVKKKKKKRSRSNSESSTKTENDKSNFERKKKHSDSDRNDTEEDKCIRNSPKKNDSLPRTSKEEIRSYEGPNTLENENNGKTMQSENDSFELKDLCYTPPKRSRLQSNLSLIDQKPKESFSLRLRDENRSHSTTPIKKNEKIHKHSRSKAESDIDLFSDLSESSKHSKQSSNGNGPIKENKSHRDYEAKSEKLHINDEGIKDRGKVRLDNTLMIKKHIHNSDKLNNDLQSTFESLLIINEKEDIKASDKKSYDDNAVEKSSGSPQISESQKSKKENKNIQDSTFQFVKKKKKKRSRSNSESSTKTENDESNVERKNKDSESDKNDSEKDKSIRNSPKKCDSSSRTSKEKKRSYEGPSTLENESNRKTVQSEDDSLQLKNVSYTPPEQSRLHSNVSLIDQKPKKTSSLRLHDEHDSHSTIPVKKKKKSHKHSRTKTESDLQLVSDKHSSFNENRNVKKTKSHRDYETNSEQLDIEDRGEIRLQNTLLTEIHSHNPHKPNIDKQPTLKSFLSMNQKEDINANDDKAVEKSLNLSQINETEKSKEKSKQIQGSSNIQLVKKTKKKRPRTNSESSIRTENYESNLKRNKKHSENDRNDTEEDKCDSSKEKKRSIEGTGTSENCLIEEPHDSDIMYNYEPLIDILELADEQRLTDDHREMLKDLIVEIPWDIHESHLIETRMSAHPLKSQQEKFKLLGFQMKTDHYLPAEDTIILDNWNRFCELHNIPNDPRPFLAFESFRNSKIKGSVLPKEQRINFVRFLGHGLPHRCLFSIYRRFKKLFDVKKKGKFSPEEDSIILSYVQNVRENNKFAQLAFILGRDRHAVLLRHKLLTKKLYM
ncbi:hypothetical protein RN001_009910 [Aquatica leii]|uniref:Uncharacterized protein n=1 Tax=Aquatica leii TaxID=1421715 RepID=A0AAN7P5M8_9COLE|nr:hypothetical protein RN001_009910 [Aquatica leii]